MLILFLVGGDGSECHVNLCCLETAERLLSLEPQDGAVPLPVKASPMEVEAASIRLGFTYANRFHIFQILGVVLPPSMRGILNLNASMLG